MRRVPVECAMLGLLLLSSCTLSDKQRDEVEDIASSAAVDAIDDSERVDEIERRVAEIERRLTL